MIMKKYFVLLPILLIINSCCKESPEEKFKRECPYTFIHGTFHNLKVPIEIIPNKLTYNIGDTLVVKAEFSDSIYDISTQKTFKIKKLAFRPIMSLSSFVNDTFLTQSFAINQVKIDEKYKPSFKNHIGSRMTYENNTYKFEAKIGLNRKGRFVLQIVDLYLINGAGGNPVEWNEEVDTIKFLGKCPNLGYSISNIIQGDDHLAQFEKELLYIDKKLSYDNWTTVKKKYFETPYGTGSFIWEFNSTYGFEVK